MRLRDGFWKAAQLALVAVFVLMGIYGGDMPLGVLCASILLGAMGGGAASPRHRRQAAAATLQRARNAGLRATSACAARAAQAWLAAGLLAWALLLVSLGRSTATLAAVLSTSLLLWLAAFACATTTRIDRGATPLR